MLYAPAGSFSSKKNILCAISPFDAPLAGWDAMFLPPCLIRGSPDAGMAPRPNAAVPASEPFRNPRRVTGFELSDISHLALCPVQNDTTREDVVSFCTPASECAGIPIQERPHLRSGGAEHQRMLPHPLMFCTSGLYHRLRICGYATTILILARVVRVILSNAKNLVFVGEILHCVQNDTLSGTRAVRE